jgi:hypothetical protein
MSTSAKTRLPCRFSNCQITFADKSNLKKHLRQRQAGGGDEYHPADDPLWPTLKEFLTVHTRPGHLTEEEKAARHAEANHRWFIKNREKLLVDAKEGRKAMKEATGLAKDLGNTLSQRETDIKKLSDAYSHNATFLGSVWGKECSTPEEWIFKDGTFIDASIFPRFITYYLPASQWPSPYGITPIIPLCSVLPAETHYRKLAVLFHPDRVPDHVELAKALNGSFDIWRKYVSSDEWKTVVGYDKDDEETFVARGEGFQEFADLFTEWTTAYIEGYNALTPQMLSQCEIKAANDECNRLATVIANVSGDGESVPTSLITRALSLPDPHLKGKGGRKRRANHDDEDNVTQGDQGTGPGNQPMEGSREIRRQRRGEPIAGSNSQSSEVMEGRITRSRGR